MFPRIIKSPPPPCSPPLIPVRPPPFAAWPDTQRSSAATPHKSVATPSHQTDQNRGSCATTGYTPPPPGPDQAHTAPRSAVLAQTLQPASSRDWQAEPRLQSASSRARQAELRPDFGLETLDLGLPPD